MPRSLQNATRCPAGIAIGTQHRNPAADSSVCTRFAGALYDHLGFYAPAFAAGALFNLANLVIIGFLVTRQARERQRQLPAVLPA